MKTFILRGFALWDNEGCYEIYESLIYAHVQCFSRMNDIFVRFHLPTVFLIPIHEILETNKQRVE